MYIVYADNYLAVYISCLEEKIVNIANVMYGRCDIGEQLKKI